MQSHSPGTLYVIATPIGNMEDITLRALRLLGEVEYVLCEDTRTTGQLCKHHGVAATLKRYDAHTSESAHAQIITDLVAGKRIALVSDAGTPGVSDPGVLLVQQARAAGARLDAVPGPSAVTAAISIAGLSGNQFAFLGFAPQKKGRQTFFAALEHYDYSVVFFESTHRILKTLDALADTVGTRQILLGRELTKLHEEMLTGTAAELLAILTTEPVKQKGEFVVVVAAA